MINLELQKRGFTEAMLKFNGLKKKLKDYRTPLSQIAVEMIGSVARNFKEQGTDKEKWKPLAASTITNYMRRKGKKSTPPFIILRDTGSLLNSIGPKITIDRAIVSTNMAKAPALHFGSEKKNIPARPYMTLRADAVARIKAIARDWAFGV